MILGLLIGACGAWLIALGGSWYYLPTGIALVVAGALLMSGNVAGIGLYVLTWIATLAWAFWEVGMDGWGLMPRVLAPTVILVFVLLTLPAFGHGRMRRLGDGAYATASAAVLVLACSLGFHHFTVAAQSQEASPATGSPVPNQANATASSGQADSTVHPAGPDWPVYGGSELATRYSPVKQINADNVSQLTKVWISTPATCLTRRPRISIRPKTHRSKWAVTYACSAKGIVISADAATGKEDWRYDPKVSDDAIPYGASCRGVAYYAKPGASAEQPCATRIVWGTLDARLVAIDAKNGKLHRFRPPRHSRPHARAGENGTKLVFRDRTADHRARHRRPGCTGSGRPGRGCAIGCRAWL